jgi:Na+/melibiose symporter-like transporter
MTTRMPIQVWILTLSAFAIGTAEFVIAGILTQVADSLHVTAGQAGHLIAAYAIAIVIGGPILTLWLARFDKRRVLLGLMALFIAGNVIGAFTDSYAVLLASRVLAGLTRRGWLPKNRRVKPWGRCSRASPWPMYSVCPAAHGSATCLAGMSRSWWLPYSA